MNPPTNSRPTQPPKLLDQVAGKMRLLHYSKRTQSAYVDWIKRFILFHNKRHPHDMGAAEIEGFLKKSKGSGLFLHGLPPLANEAGKLNYPFNRVRLRGITFY